MRKVVTHAPMLEVSSDNWHVSDGRTEVTVTESAGADGAVVVFVDTHYEPDGSDDGPGLRIVLNDEDAFVGVEFVPYGMFAIVSLDERDECGDRLYWSNHAGWTVSWDADLFEHDEIVTLRLPQGGAWVPMDWEPSMAAEVVAVSGRCGFCSAPATHVGSNVNTCDEHWDERLR